MRGRGAVAVAVLAASVVGTTTRVGAAPSAVEGEPPREDVATVATVLPPELEAMQRELLRGLEGLRLDDAPRPYRAEARSVRADLLSIDGSYGGLITDVLDRQTTGTVEVRVGSLERDNSNFMGSESGIVRLDVPLEAAPEYMRKRLWLGLDAAFRGATRAYAAKKVTLERLAVEELHDLTSPPPPITRTVELASTPFDREGLAGMVARLSGRFSARPSIDNGDVHLQVLRSHETVVDTEGHVLQWARERAVLAVVADTRAPDGMQLDHGHAIQFQSVPALDATLERAGEQLVDRVLAELEELAAAPMIEEEYDGPILFTGPAAAQLIASTIAIAAAGTPPPLGEGGRMMDFEPAWQKQLRRAVMPPFIDVVDDPTVPGFGHYEIDAEGVVPRRVALVEAGQLEHLLMTRTPNAKRSGSNGRARMTPSLQAGPAISNLVVSSRKRGLAQTALERDLLARAREDGYEFAYVIELLRDGTILGDVPRDSATAYAGTGKLDLPLPARIYRIESGGRRTLVRGAVLAPASMRVLRRIRAVGQTPHVVPMRIPVGPFGGFNSDVGIDGVLSLTVDVEVTCPDLLVDGLELLVERGEHERPPTLVHPLRRPQESEGTTPAGEQPEPGTDGTRPGDASESDPR